MTDKKTAKRFVCIHGHFYQPFRKNPWTEEIDLQKDAYPYKDWNERINAECYRANAFAHILGSDGKLKEICNNYSKISFNFGPTLLEWIKENDNKTYKRIIEADFQGRENFSGHGTAIAQNYNHLIMPLANRQDKILQVFWSVYDFEKNFNRKPEGMWLAETAVDYETLEVLAEFGIKYTILSPFQALRCRKSAKIYGKNKVSTDLKSAPGEWIFTENGSIDTRKPYFCNLPSGKNISVFFYDKDISTAISFGDLLKNGEEFAERIINASYTNEDQREIIIIASDGEAYGHHKKFGDMALAYCLKTIQADKDTELTVFGEYLEMFPPDFEVEIIENTAWSCSHFLSRWEGGCTCGIPENLPDGQWSQEWRIHLRKAIKKIREEIDKIYYSNIKKYVKDGIADHLEILKDYITVVSQREYGNINIFLDKYSQKNKSIKPGNNFGINLINGEYTSDESLLLSILEMQRQAMLMQSSDAWFFDDISRIEAIQVFRHALRAIELGSYFNSIRAKEIQKMFSDILKSAKSNIIEGKNGSDIFLSESVKKKYSTEEITADFITEFLTDSDPENHTAFQNGKDIFDFYNHEFMTKQIIDFNDEFFSGKSGGLYIISKTTLKKEFCLFFFITGKSENLFKNDNNELLEILIRKKTGGNENNSGYSSETDFFNEFIKQNLRDKNIGEVFFKLKRKPGFRYFDLNNISEKVKINYFEKNAIIKTKSLYKGLSSYKSYVNNIDETVRKWINTGFADNEEVCIDSILIKSKIFLILNKNEINKNEIEELEYLADKNNSVILSEKAHGDTVRTGFEFLKTGAEQLLRNMINKYIDNLTDAEILKIIIRLLKVCDLLQIRVDFLKMQDHVFKVKITLGKFLKNQKENLDKEIHDSLLFLLDYFKIEHLFHNEAF
ncbi:MAG TPA: hypothetical protein DCY00_02655 [Actinobacteria bacterium]|nr:hypothetical protein [Actinomycetota bacterium]